MEVDQRRRELDQLPAGDDGPHGEADAVENYCDIQCYYDNVIEADPTNPNVVFAARPVQLRPGPQSGGIFRSTTAARPGRTSAGTCIRTSTPSPGIRATRHVAIGNDGGVW